MDRPIDDRAAVFAGAAETARRIAHGELTASAAVEASLARIEARDGPINAVPLRLADEARARAAAADRAPPGARGPLHGVPITIKECFDLAGTPSTFGYPERAAHRPDRDAFAVSRLLAAGAIVLGKTNVPKDLSDWQSFNALYGTTRNPWNPERSPGGSSGGSAAALAAGFSALELGSDIGGSIRMPAHFCGVYGHKPTFGVVPVSGHAMDPLAPPQDINVVGPLARTVEDLALAMDLIVGVDGPAARATSIALPPPSFTRIDGARVAVITGDGDFPVDAATAGTARRVAEVLRDAGARVTVDPPLPLPSRQYYRLYVALLRAATSTRRSEEEIAALLPQARALAPDDDGYEALMLRGLTQSHRAWQSRRAERVALRAAWERWFADCDAVIAPISPTASFPHMQDVPKPAQKLLVDGVSRPNADTYFWLGIASAPGLPATAIPAGASAEGLPIGLQIIGRAYGDRTTLAIAAFLERAHRGFAPPPGY
jgi:amidase